jgi:hypothetical protein
MYKEIVAILFARTGSLPERFMYYQQHFANDPLRIKLSDDEVEDGLGYALMSHPKAFRGGERVVLEFSTENDMWHAYTIDAAHINNGKEYSKFEPSYLTGLSAFEKHINTITDFYAARDNKIKLTAVQLGFAQKLAALSNHRWTTFDIHSFGDSPTAALIEAYVKDHSAGIKLSDILSPMVTRGIINGCYQGVNWAVLQDGTVYLILMDERKYKVKLQISFVTGYNLNIEVLDRSGIKIYDVLALKKLVLDLAMFTKNYGIVEQLQAVFTP